MRFAEPFTQAGKSSEAKLDAERLMFLELTQGLKNALMYCRTNTEFRSSLPLGKFHRSFVAHQYD
jgi:hypothetical protein